MNYNAELLNNALLKLSYKRELNHQELNKRHFEITSKFPQVKDLEKNIKNAGIKASKIILTSFSISADIDSLRDLNLSSQKKIKEILTQNGYPENYLEIWPTCKTCNDTGYIEQKYCSCLEDMIKKEIYNNLNNLSPLSLSSFSTFDLSLYSNSPNNDNIVPRETMERIFNFCKAYAFDFSMKSPNIFMVGATGLGKTHLSLAIANEVINKNYNVIYSSALDIFNRLEKERFSRDYDQSIDTMQSLLSCDLLILDDLGTEMTTQFIISSVYNIINTRLLSVKPTIINTNVTFNELKNKYSDRILSRLLGEYHILKFIGDDVRLKDVLKK